jgi:hypothetical protein
MSLDQARPEATPYRGLCRCLFLVGLGRLINCGFGIADCGFLLKPRRPPEATPYQGLCGRLFFIRVSKYEANFQAFDKIPFSQDSPKCSSISHPCFRHGEVGAQKSLVATESRRILLCSFSNWTMFLPSKTPVETKPTCANDPASVEPNAQTTCLKSDMIE